VIERRRYRGGVKSKHTLQWEGRGLVRRAGITEVKEPEGDSADKIPGSQRRQIRTISRKRKTQCLSPPAGRRWRLYCLSDLGVRELIDGRGQKNESVREGFRIRPCGGHARLEVKRSSEVYRK